MSHAFRRQCPCAPIPDKLPGTPVRIDAALSTAATLLGMEVVFIGGFAEDRFRFERVRGHWDGISEGYCVGAADSFCARMLASGHTATASAGDDPVFQGTPVREVDGHHVLCRRAHP